MGTVKVDNLVNQSGDQDSGLDLATNDQVKVKTANTTRVTVTDAATTVANTLTASTGITVSDGNITVASGHGIDFSAQTAASSASASATGELFDRYEEGIFTHAGNANMTIDAVSARGFYTIIGDKCFVNGFVRFTHSSTNNVYISLPVASKADITSPANGEQESAQVAWFPSVTTSGNLGGISIGYVASGGGSIFFYHTGTASGLINNNNLATTGEVYYNLNYKIA